MKNDNFYFHASLLRWALLRRQGRDFMQHWSCFWLNVNQSPSCSIWEVSSTELKPIIFSHEFQILRIPLLSLLCGKEETIGVAQFSESSPLCSRSMLMNIKKFPQFFITSKTSEPSLCHRFLTYSVAALDSRRAFLSIYLSLQFIRINIITVELFKTERNERRKRLWEQKKVGETDKWNEQEEISLLFTALSVM